MQIIDHLIETLNFDATVRDLRQGVFHTGVLSRYCGLAATLPRDALRQQAPLVRESGFLLDKTPGDLVRLAYSDSILEAAIGVATINSLLDVDLSGCTELNAADLILRKGQGKRVAIVGHFPFLPRLRDQVKQLWVIEKNPAEDDHPESAAQDLIPRAEVVAITGTALTNHSLGHLLELCDPRAYVLMLGDSVPLSPVLFEYGVDALAGTRVIDPQRALLCVSQGANFRQIQGVKRLILEK